MKCVISKHEAVQCKAQFLGLISLNSESGFRSLTEYTYNRLHKADLTPGLFVHNYLLPFQFFSFLLFMRLPFLFSIFLAFQLLRFLIPPSHSPPIPPPPPPLYPYPPNHFLYFIILLFTPQKSSHKASFYLLRKYSFNKNLISNHFRCE